MRNRNVPQVRGLCELRTSDLQIFRWGDVDIL